MIDKLKNEKISSKLSDTNIFKFAVNFDKDVGISLNTHREYITKFGETFYEQVKRLIDKNQLTVEKEEEMNPLDKEVAAEVLDHARFCKEKVSQFHGRNDLLERMKEYLLDPLNNAPFLIQGESGCGKTAVLAKLAYEVIFFYYNYCVKFLIDNGLTGGPICSDISFNKKTTRYIC